MPDPAPAKRRVLVPTGATGAGATLSDVSGRTTSSQAASTVRYAELHCKTNFSFLRGASHPDELVNRAVALGYSALAITDRNSLAGIVRAHAAAKAVGLKLVIGAEITPQDGPTLLLYAPDRASYGRL